jgi:hypothetical protein
MLTARLSTQVDTGHQVALARIPIFVMVRALTGAKMDCAGEFTARSRLFLAININIVSSGETLVLSSLL